MLKCLIVHNFFDSNDNIDMLHLKILVSMTEIQLNKNFGNLSYPVLTTTQYNEKLHILYFNSLVIL